jgi:hypothetical protein
MDLNNTIKALCEIAKEFEEKGNVSESVLLTESGYLQNPGQINEAHMAEYLRNHRELIDTWLLQSMNKRTPPWYLKSPVDYSNRHKVWVVGFYPDGEVREFQDAADACGFYVKQEVEQIRHIIEKTS